MKNNKITKFLYLTYLGTSIIITGALLFELFQTAINPAKAVILKEIQIKGTEKFDPEIIKSAIDLPIGKDIKDADIDSAVKKLYKLNMFSDISVENDNGKLTFNITENAIINKIAFEGNSELATEDILKELTIKPKSMYSKSLVRMNASKLMDMYKTLGFLSVIVEPKVIKLENGQVNVVFEITEGKKAFIRDIRFNGNKEFDSSELIEIIMSKEYAWWKIFQQFDSYDENRIKYDTELLKKFYTAKGFLDVVIESPAVISSIDKTSFYILFNIKEGQRYKISSIDLKSEMPEIETEQLKKEILIKPNNWYDVQMINISMKNITDKLGESGYAFIQVIPDLKTNKEKGTVDLTFIIKESRKMYINKISISGNTRTFDTVIRREMSMKEQDTYNTLTLKESEQKLNYLGYFESVKFNLNPDLQNPDKINLEVEVAEKSTGEISASIGYSSLNGLILELGVKENNFRGKGQQVAISGSIADLQKRVLLSFTEPYFLNRDLSAGIDLFYNRYDYSRYYGYDIDGFGASTRFGWRYTNKLYHSAGLTLRSDLYSNIDPSLKETMQVGWMPQSKIYHTLSYRDSIADFIKNRKFDYSLRLSNELSAGLSRVPYFKTDGEIKLAYTFADSRISIGGSINGGHIDPFETYLDRSYRYFLGGENLRGFAIAGAGSRINSGYTAGGNSIAYGTLQVSFPIGVPKEYKVLGFLFYDFGWISPPDDKDALHAQEVNKPDGSKDIIYTKRYRYIDNTIRSSIGLGIYWESPMGPLQLTWGYPLTYEKYDEKEVFRFTIRTLF